MGMACATLWHIYHCRLTLTDPSSYIMFNMPRIMRTQVTASFSSLQQNLQTYSGPSAGHQAGYDHADEAEEDIDAGYSTAIVQAEDKELYPDADDVYAGVEVRVEDEDQQAMSQPIVASVAAKSWASVTTQPPETTHGAQFLGALLSAPASIRNVAVAGHLGSGKTELCDILASAPWSSPPSYMQPLRYTDTRKDEQARNMSIAVTPFTTVARSSAGKSYALNVADTPGHPTFVQDVAAACRASDAMLCVVDVVEGVRAGAVAAIREATRARLPIVLVINKIDRLILELKLPPEDAYFKLLHVIAEANAALSEAAFAEAKAAAAEPGPSQGKPLAEHPGVWRPAKFDPVAGNVLLGAGQHMWVTSLPAWAARYAAQAGRDRVTAGSLVQRLWGDVWYNTSTQRFTKRRPSSGDAAYVRSAVHFLLEPLYKVYATVVAEDPEVILAMARGIHVSLSEKEAHMDPAPLLTCVLSRWWGSAAPVVDALLAHSPDPASTVAVGKAVHSLWQGDCPSTLQAALMSSAADGPLLVDVVRLLPTPDCSTFLAWGRVWSGSLSAGDTVEVRDAGWKPGMDERVGNAVVSGVYAGHAQSRSALSRAGPGSWVLVEGVADLLTGPGSLVSPGESATAGGFVRPIHAATEAVVRVSLEALVPAELPRLLDGIRGTCKAYPSITSHIEESGEHVLCGVGELDMDCALHDLRNVYTQVEVRLSEPITRFAETVGSTSSLMAFADTPNGYNRLTVIAEPLDASVVAAADAGRIDPMWSAGELRRYMRVAHGWDELAAKSLWAFGPGQSGPNVFINDILPTTVDTAALWDVRGSMEAGFQWAVREGPLTDEPMRGVKLRMLDAALADSAVHRGAGQIMATSRRAVYSAFLLAKPRLLEPIYKVEITCPVHVLSLAAEVLSKRRGHATAEAAIPGSPFYRMEGYVPVMDAFGLETDLRVRSQGAGMVLQSLDHWGQVPGDPLDTNVQLHALERAPNDVLAREFTVKMRRRKGLPDDVAVVKYFDEAMIAEIAKEQAALEAADVAQEDME